MEERLRKMDEQMQVRGLADLTRATYLRHVRKLAEYHDGLSVEELHLEHVESFLLHLFRDRGYMSSTRNQYASGLRFFFGLCPLQHGARSSGLGRLGAVGADDQAHLSIPRYVDGTLERRSHLHEPSPRRLDRATRCRRST